MLCSAACRSVIVCLVLVYVLHCLAWLCITTSCPTLRTLYSENTEANTEVACCRMDSITILKILKAASTNRSDSFLWCIHADGLRNILKYDKLSCEINVSMDKVGWVSGLVCAADEQAKGSHHNTIFKCQLMVLDSAPVDRSR